MDSLNRIIDLLGKLLPILALLPPWLRYMTAIYVSLAVPLIITITYYWLTSSTVQPQDNDAMRKPESTVYQEQIVRQSPGSTNIQANQAIIIQSPPPHQSHQSEPNDPSSARKELGRLNVPYSSTAFISSARQGDTIAVGLLIKAGMGVNVKMEEYGRTALMESAEMGYLDTMEALLQKGADINAQDRLGDTALILAAHKGQFDAVRALLKKGANQNVKNIAGRTALRVASENGHTTIVSALLDKGAELESRDKEENKTPLLAAAMHHQTQIVKLLLDRGADPNVCDKYGHSALIPTARAGHVEMVRALLEHGAAVNAADNDGRTALMGAAVNDHPEVIALLLKHKADLKLTDKGGKTALQWAESMSHQTVINQLKNAASRDNA